MYARASLFVVFVVAFTAASACYAAVAKLAAPAVQDRVEVSLPSSADDIVVGGDGRYLIIEMKALRKLAVFDVTLSKIARFLSVDSDDMIYAAGSEKLLVVLKDRGVLQRWDLRTFERELSVPTPDGQEIQAIAMGCRSRGLAMLLAVDGHTTFIDSTTMKKVEFDKQAMQQWEGKFHGGRADIRASEDGTCFTAWRNGSSPSGVIVLRLMGKSVSCSYEHESLGYLLPGVDGSIIYTAQGLLTRDLKPLLRDTFWKFNCLPVIRGNYFIAAPSQVYSRFYGRSEGSSDMLIYSANDRKLLASMGEIPELVVPRTPPRGLGDSNPLSLEKRLYFAPKSNALVVLPDSMDRLIIRRFDLVEAMDKAGTDYLFVKSLPPVEFRKGQTYSYQMEVLSKRGGVNYAVASGPSGMAISKTGLLKWVVPANYSGSEETVLVTVRDASGQEIYHTAKIRLDQ